MRDGARTALFIGFLLVGVLLVGLFGLLFLVSDCEQDCQARGEHATPILLGSGGVLLIATGSAMERGWRRAWAMGAIVGGVMCLVWSGYAAYAGDRGWIWSGIVVGVAAVGLGVWLRRRYP